ncbi:MAG: hypothetical protein MO852_10605 [Candidatus Devosia euplotis]|nr:hypothetical protein [Candidatus Devosia euplotis]
MRFAFGAASQRDVEQAVQEVNALYCCGPAGVGVRQSVRPRVRALSHLVLRHLVRSGFHFAGAVQ